MVYFTYVVQSDFFHDDKDNDDQSQEYDMRELDMKEIILENKLDVSHPLHLDPNDSSTLTVVSIKLKRIENYNVRSCAMLLASEGRNKTGFINNTYRRYNTDEVLDTFERVDDSVTFNLQHKINSWSQSDGPIVEYFNKLSTLWKQFNALVQLPSNILAREPLPDAKGAYFFISSEESHKAVVTGLGDRTSQRSQSFVFNSSVTNRRNAQRATSGPTLICMHYRFNEHTIDMCFKLTGYPADFRKKEKFYQ
nr:hypothetical protein [Tanacetum cinerariifolium]